MLKITEINGQNISKPAYTDELLLAAYKVLKDYCLDHGLDCNGCIFKGIEDDEDRCVFDTGLPDEWPDMEGKK